MLIVQDLGLPYELSAQEIVKPDPRDMLVLLLFLFQVRMAEAVSACVWHSATGTLDIPLLVCLPGLPATTKHTHTHTHTLATAGAAPVCAAHYHRVHVPPGRGAGELRRLTLPLALTPP